MATQTTIKGQQVVIERIYNGGYAYALLIDGHYAGTSETPFAALVKAQWIIG